MAPMEQPVEVKNAGMMLFRSNSVALGFRFVENTTLALGIYSCCVKLCRSRIA